MRHVLDLGIQSIWLERHAALDRLGTEYLAFSVTWKHGIYMLNFYKINAFVSSDVH